MNKTKEDFVASLKNVKIVIGNGFDLHCHLHTKYDDYFLYRHELYDYINEKFDTYQKTDEFDIDGFYGGKYEINVWDVFFAIDKNKTSRSDFYWCDIERLMLFSFLERPNIKSPIKELAMHLGSSTNWRDIFELICKDQTGINHSDRFIAKLCKWKMDKTGFYPRDFYKFLLQELKMFEKKFGNFVKWQITKNNGYIRIDNQQYVYMAETTLKKLAKLENIVSVDSFNYTTIYSKEIFGKIHHINGDWTAPIFGIDTRFSPDDDCYIFTKTSRRIDNDLFNNEFDGRVKFDNLVVYGHSLNEADYSYFFPSFDQMGLLDATRDSVFVYAYSVPNKNSVIERKKEINKSIANIIFAYAKSKMIPDPERLLDSLSTQQRIVTYDI